MKYYSTLPLTAIVAIVTLYALVQWQVIPSGFVILEWLQAQFDGYFYLLIFLIILAESIVYVGFYFPGQLFAVLLVVSQNPSPSQVFWLTLSMVAAATLGSAINFILGRVLGDHDEKAKLQPTPLRHLLLAMIHINALAFFMFAQGANHKKPKVVLLAGFLNLPYYLLLIAGTAILSESVMMLAENILLLALLIGLWLIISLILDVRRHRGLQAAQKNQR